MSKKDLGCFYTLSHPFVRFRRLYLLSYAFICFHKLLYDFICFHTLLYPFQHFQIHFYTLLHAFMHFLYAFLRIQTQKSKTPPLPPPPPTPTYDSAAARLVKMNTCSKYVWHMLEHPSLPPTLLSRREGRREELWFFQHVAKSRLGKKTRKNTKMSSNPPIVFQIFKRVIKFLNMGSF